MAALLVEVPPLIRHHHVIHRSLIGTMKKARVALRRARMATLMDTSPTTVYRYLNGVPPAWGSVPLMGPSGLQCDSSAEFDKEVQRFWVQSVWRRSEGEDAGARWAAFLASEFADCVPRCVWPQPPWDGQRVVKVFSP